MKFVNDLNLKKQADDLGIKVWQTPGFLFILFGLIAVFIMTAIYFISKNYDNPEVLIIAESLVVIVVMIIGTAVVRLVDQITRINKIKSEFVSIVSHQLRTPLSAIKWETELFLSKFKKELNKKQVKDIENIANLNQRMIKLVNDLLDVARIDQNRLIIRKEKFNFSKILEDIVKEFSPLAKNHNIEITLNIKKRLPLAFADPNKIKLAVENLLTNSIKYTNSGGKIEIKLFKEADNLVFEIKDSGVGIPEEQLKRVFEKFFRSDNAVKYQTEGTGLGLYIAKNIIDQSGGKMWFQSMEKVGSVFSFSIPSVKH